MHKASPRSIFKFQSISSAIWDAPSSPNIYAHIDLDLTAIANSESGKINFNPLALVACAAQRAWHKEEFLRRKVGMWGRIVPKPFGLTFVANTQDHELRFLPVLNPNLLQISEVENWLMDQAQILRDNPDGQLWGAVKHLHRIPRRWVHGAVRAWIFMTQQLGWTFGRWSEPNPKFGTVLISDLKFLDAEVIFLAAVAPTFSAVTLGVGKITLKPKCIHGEVRARWVLPLYFTADHRLLNGSHCALLLQKFREEVDSLLVFARL